MCMYIVQHLPVLHIVMQLHAIWYAMTSHNVLIYQLICTKLHVEFTFDCEYLSFDLNTTVK